MTAARPWPHQPPPPAPRPAAAPRPPEPLMTIADIAARWQVSYMSVRRLIGNGELHALRIGRSLRIPVASVHRYEQAARLRPGDTGDGA